MKYRLSQIRACISWLVGHILPNRKVVKNEHEQKISFYDCGGNFYYFPYLGRSFFRAVRSFCRSHPELELTSAIEFPSYRGMGPGFMLACNEKKKRIKELV